MEVDATQLYQLTLEQLFNLQKSYIELNALYLKTKMELELEKKKNSDLVEFSE